MQRIAMAEKNELKIIKDLEVWNLKAKVKQPGFNKLIDTYGMQCSPDSKYYFISCVDNTLVQWNILDNKLDHVYKFGGQVSNL